MDSLFDFADDEQPVPAAPEVERQDWHEVPQSIYLSWPTATQLAYCAARDIDSADRAETADEIEWFLARAKSYQEMVNGHERQ